MTSPNFEATVTAGGIAAAGLEQVIEGARALDMEEIRAKIDVVKQTA